MAADILVVNNFADAVGSSRLAGGSNQAAVVVGSVLKAQRLGGQEADRWVSELFRTPQVCGVT